MDREELAEYLNQTLEAGNYRDYCPNGLQVEGRHRIAKLVTGVTASLALIDAAIAADADAILVHHGYFWRNEDPRVVGNRQRRLKRLLAADINLFANHLPLDMHPELGNNAQLGKLLGLEPDGRFGENGLGWLGGAPGCASVGAFAERVERALHRKPQLIGDPAAPLKRVAWCTGAAQSLLADAVNAGADLYLSGEISEPTVHLARESGVAYLGCGHHATERYGVMAVGRHVAERFGIAHEFIEIDNPV